MTEADDCRSKRRFASRGKAEYAVWAIRRTGDRRGDRKPRRAYRCPHCKGWHLTSQERGW